MHHNTPYRGTDMSEMVQNETPQENCLNKENPQQNLDTEHGSPEKAASNVKPVVYADESWSFARFAWEFLRLNKKFKAACDKAENAESRRKVARKYGLKHFVHYSKEFDTKPAIRFNGIDISSWSNLSISKKKKVRPNRRLKNGEIGIYFDLNFMLKEPAKSLERQLDQARQTLSKRLQTYAKKKNKNLQGGKFTNQKEKPILAYNVYIDVERNGKSQIDALLFHKSISRDTFNTDPNAEKNQRSSASRAYQTANFYISKKKKCRGLALLVDKNKESEQ
jgi:hypothetical protein